MSATMLLAPAATALVLLTAAIPVQPTVSTISPSGGQRGTEVEVTFRGARLDGAYDVLLPKPGIELVAVTREKADRCKAVFRIPADCPLGAYPLRLCTQHGIANLRMFHVGALPEVRERDGAVNEVPFGSTINGAIRGEETDRYSVEVTADTPMRCEVQAMRLGRAPLDLHLQVFDPTGKLVAAADDTAFGHKDPWLALRTEVAGKYEVRVGPAFPDRANRGAYRLHIGSFPRPTAAQPAGGAPGQTVELTFVEACSPDRQPSTATVTLPDDGSEFTTYFPEDDRGVAPTPVVLRTGGPPNQTPKADDKGRRFLAMPCSVHGVVPAKNKSDKFWFKGKKGRRVDFRVFARTMRSALDPFLIVRRADGRYLAGDDDGAGAGDSRLRFTPPADGDYQVEVRDLMRTGSPAHTFRLEAGTVAGGMRTSLVVQRRTDPVCNVPRGGAACFVLRLDGADTKAGLTFAADNLPPGVTAHFGPVRGNRVPFVLQAAPDAELSASLADLTLSAQKEPKVRDPGYRQIMSLVTVRNDRPILSTIGRRIPVAVARPEPFQIEIEAPSVPLVRDGRLYVKIKVQRNKGFVQSIRVRSPLAPSGIGVAQITIKGDKSEAWLPLEASGSATLGEFPLAIIATAGSRDSYKQQGSLFQTVVVEKHWLVAKLHRARTPAGQNTQLRVEFDSKRKLDKPYSVKLHGLPKHVTAKPLEIAPDAKQGVFELQVDPKARPGRYRSLRVEIEIPSPKGKVRHRFGGGELRIDRPVAGDTTSGEEAQS